MLLVVAVVALQCVMDGLPHHEWDRTMAGFHVGVVPEVVFSRAKQIRFHG